MKISKLQNMTRGWLIGNFEPSIYRTTEFEAGILTHRKDEKWPWHYHATATEYNILIAGTMSVCGKELETGDIFIIEPHEIADPIFHEDCTIVCIKVPSLPNDKYIVSKNSQ